MLNQVGGSKADTIVKLALIFFISLLSFSVGTFVGKQVSDSDYKRAELEEDYKSFRQASHGEDQKTNHDEKVSEEELSSLTEEFVNKEKEAMKKKDGHRDIASTQHDKKKAESKTKLSKEHSGYKKYAKGQMDEEFIEKDKVKKKLLVAYRNKLKNLDKNKKTTSKEKYKSNRKVAKIDKKIKASPASVTKEANRVAAGKAPIKDPKKRRKPASILPSSVAISSIGKYTVQVASYVSKEEAKAHASELKQKGWNAFYIPAEVKGRTWFRVSIGLFTNQKSAMSFREELMGQSSVSSAIIQKITQ